MADSAISNETIHFTSANYVGFQPIAGANGRLSLPQRQGVEKMLTRNWTEWAGWLVLPAVLVFAGVATCAGEDGHRVPNRVAWAYQVAHAGQTEYWIGVMGAPADPLLQKHLKIDAGIVIQHVVPDSPAGKAGIKEDDILLKFGDVEVSDVTALAKVIADTGAKESKVVLVHEGKQKTVAVTPAERPDTVPIPPAPPATDLKELHDWLEKMRKGELGKDPFRMWSMQPGVVVPKEWRGFHAPRFGHQQFHLVLPKNTSVTITRADDGPAKIVVKKGGQTWEVNEDELDKLPEDVRRIVRGVLGRSLGFTIPGGGDFRFEWDGKRFKQPIRPVPKRAPVPKAERDKQPGAASADQDLDTVLKKLDEMNQRLREREKETERQMEKLRQEVERLKRTDV